jgi:hypothetical protein
LIAAANPARECRRALGAELIGRSRTTARLSLKPILEPALQFAPEIAGCNTGFRNRRGNVNVFGRMRKRSALTEEVLA